MVDEIYNYGLDRRYGRLWVTGEITEESSVPIVKGLVALMDADLSTAEIVIASTGGDVFATLAIYDQIQRLARNMIVWTQVVGQCYSSAVLLAAGGTPGYRVATRHSEFLWHACSADVSGRFDDASISLTRIGVWDDRWTNAIVYHTQRHRDTWDQLTAKKIDYWFDAEEAVSRGIIDKIT